VPVITWFNTSNNQGNKLCLGYTSQIIYIKKITPLCPSHIIPDTCRMLKYFDIVDDCPVNNTA